VTLVGVLTGNTDPALVASISLLLLFGVVLWRLGSRLARTRAELAELRAVQEAQTARWHATLSSMPDGLMVLDSDMRLAEWNERFPAFSGVPLQVLKPGLDLETILRAQAEGGEFGPVDPVQEAHRRAELMKVGLSSGTIERRRPNGQILELRRNPMAGGGFVTLYTDVTSRRRAEEQLRQAQKMEAIGHLTAGVAHDFNNLLTVISGNLGMAVSALEAGQSLRARSHLELARHGAERAAALTQRLVAFSRRQNLEPQPIDANKIVSGMTELVRHSLGEVQLETVLAGEVWVAVADRSQLENAILNLAVNARDAMPEGGRISIETANAYLDDAYAAAHEEVRAGQYVMVAVSDNGTGMSPEEVARAFEPFYTTKEVGKGSGLGLSQVFGFIKQSNGHVKIYSELGSGTTVKLYLPRHVSDDPPVRLREPAPRKELPRARQGETILMVEDDPDVLTYTSTVLESLDYRVVGTRDPDFALSVLDTHPGIVLLFSDISLPKRNGPELAAEALRRRPELGVLFTTGYPTNAVLHQERLQRAVAVISKPFTVPQLAKALRKAIDG
jgi:signal transduction histidine kinase/ActR/RegA family two-component response regulator